VVTRRGSRQSWFTCLEVVCTQGQAQIPTRTAQISHLAVMQYVKPPTTDWETWGSLLSMMGFTMEPMDATISSLHSSGSQERSSLEWRPLQSLHFRQNRWLKYRPCDAGFSDGERAVFCGNNAVPSCWDRSRWAFSDNTSSAVNFDLFTKLILNMNGCTNASNE
jgi:hypothetical protein